MANKTDRLINDGENRIAIAENDFANQVKRSESAILAEIKKLFDVVDVSGGKLQNNKKTTEFLLSLEKRITEALTKSGYNKAVTDLLKNFDYIKQNNIDIQSSLNGEIIGNTALNDITQLEVQNTINRLTGAGISKDFIDPIRQSIYRNITLGADINDAQKTIEDYILTQDGKDSKLLKYSKQVARDSLSQYDGAIQTAISDELGLTDYIYAGSLIIDSRAQCRYWVEKVKLPGDELKAEIEIALRNGTLGGNKCSGMIPETTVGTFAIYRGGYNCRHRAIPTKLLGTKLPEKKLKIGELMRNARIAGPQIDELSKTIAAKYSATVTPINYKSQESITRKAKNDYGGDFGQVKDAVRNTIIAETKNIDAIINDLKASGKVLRLKEQKASSDPLGYSGYILNVKEGKTISEVQVNTSRMIYGKEKESDARRILGNDVYDKIKKETGIKGGLGHTLYEEYRELDPTIPKELLRMKEIEKLSKEYYASIRN